ncbi:MAG: beta-lactamase family protein [Acidobacteria bacterium]|nr:beta-lactamase family protein [Acidobacteriota bacterium]
MNKSLRLNFLLFVSICLCGLTVRAQQAQISSELSPELLKQIEAIIESEREKHKMPGLSVAIGMNNRLVYSRGFGAADLEHNVAARPDTVYRTASIAKAMTATAVMQLVDAGRIDLDAPVNKYCLAFPEKQWPVTTRQLLGHLGGVRHYNTSAEAAGTRHFTSIVESLTIFRQDPLLHEPGTKFNYTTYGYTVLGCAIEGASGMTYEDYMKARVFARAGMTNTGIDHFRLVIPNRASGYALVTQAVHQQLPEVERKIFKPGDIGNAALHDTSMKIPGGGLVSTAVDLVRFAAAVNTGAIAGDKSRALMWTVQKTSDGKETGYGLGWGVSGEGDRLLVSHSGGQAGTSTLLTLMPSKGSIIAVMCNMQNVNLGDMVSRIGQLLVPPPQ